MTEDEHVYAEWMPYLIMFIVVAGITVTGYILSLQWISGAPYQVPAGVPDSIEQKYILSCFAAHDTLTLRPLDVIDMREFTEIKVRSCLSRAYKLTINGKTVTTSAWNDALPSEKVTPINIRILEDGKVSDARLLVEVHYE